MPHYSEEYMTEVRPGQIIYRIEEDATEDPLSVFQPVIKAHAFLIQIDIFVLSSLKGLLDVESWWGMDMPDTKTPYRTHGGVI